MSWRRRENKEKALEVRLCLEEMVKDLSGGAVPVRAEVRAEEAGVVAGWEVQIPEPVPAGDVFAPTVEQKCLIR